MPNWNAERPPVLPVEWKTAARSDLIEIVDYIARDNPQAADQMKFILYEAAERLGEMPYINRRGRVAGTREKIAHPNYIIVYRVTSDKCNAPKSFALNFATFCTGWR
nr:type II toxin-antitoxin system RelE/ParE family toxin [Neisseria perflava]